MSSVADGTRVVVLSTSVDLTYRFRVVRVYPQWRTGSVFADVELMPTYASTPLEFAKVTRRLEAVDVPDGAELTDEAARALVNKIATGMILDAARWLAHAGAVLDRETDHVLCVQRTPIKFGG